MADALREESHPLSHLISHTSPLLLIEPVCTVLKGTASVPELSRVWSPVPSRDWIFAGFLLFCFFLSQVLSTDSAWAKYCGLIRSSSEPGVHLPAANYSQNKTKLLGQLPQSLLCLPFNRCPHFNSKALFDVLIPFFSSSFKSTCFKSAPALFAHLHLVVNKEKGAALLLGTKGYNFEQLPCGFCLVTASLGFPTQGRLCMWPFKLNLLHMFSGSSNWTYGLTTIQWV